MGAAILALLPAPLERGVVAILVAHVAFNLAVVVRTVGALWEHLPPDLEAAAATLGASPWRASREITLPLLRPAIARRGGDRLPLHVHVVRRGADPRRRRQTTIEVEIWRRATQLGDIGGAATLAAAPARRARPGRRLVGPPAAAATAGRSRCAHGAEAPAPRRPSAAAGRRHGGRDGRSWCWRRSSPSCERSLRAATATRWPRGAPSAEPRSGPGIRSASIPLGSLAASLRPPPWRPRSPCASARSAALAIVAPGGPGGCSTPG